MKKVLLLPLAILAAAIGFSRDTSPPDDGPRRIEVLFLGAPTANGPAHDPIERYRLIRKELGTAGINFTYTEDLADLNRDNLGRYDALLMYANWNQNDPMDPEMESALVGYVENGGAFLPIHCASACFGGSEAFVKLVGGRFKSHGDGVFRTQITSPDHPIMRGYQGFETWDETYVHDRHGDDRTILQVREQEPWTWVRAQGKGRVFYTAYGHDMRTWSQAGFHELLRRAILWSVGDEVRSKLLALKLPELEMEEMILPGYLEKKVITQGQKPLSPQESMKLAQVPQGYRLELFASEPDIVNPIHIAWDHRGRAYVMETIDYPNNLQAKNIGNDRITICEDTNGDGRADKFTRFAEKLSIPTSMVFANGGVICTNGSEILFLKDTTGDDKADERRVLFSGFNMGDTHAGPSNLRYGPDGWIYATIGYSGFAGTVGGQEHKFSTGLFRFLPDGSKLEFLQGTTNNTWGLGFTSDFDILGSTANGNPSWVFTFPLGAYNAAGLDQPRTPQADNNPLFFPSSTDIRQVDQHGRYTSAASHAFYTADRFPESYRNKIAFVCGPTGKLVGQFAIEPKGASYVATQLPNNLYSSADGWSAPVMAEVGPDGAVWICDWYNIIVQHNPTPNANSAGYDAKNGRGNAYETPLRDIEHGRIYRVFPANTPEPAQKTLDPADSAGLVAALADPNLLWSTHAQRLLVESRATATVPKLLEIVKSDAPGALHAFHALRGLGALELDTLKSALSSKQRGVRRAAVSLAPLDDSLAQSYIREGIVTAADPRELAEVLVAMARLAPSEPIGRALHKTLLSEKETFGSDRTLSDAWQIAARQHAPGVLLAAAESPPEISGTPVNLIADGGFDEVAAGGNSAWTLRNYAEERPGTTEMAITAEGRNGGNALRIRAANRADVGAGLEVNVKPNARYRLSGWVRTEGLRNRGGRGALLNVHGGAATNAISGNNDWTELSVEFTTGNQNRILVHCLFGGYGGSVGTAWWDDLSLQEISSDDIGGALFPVVDRFASHGDPALRVALTEKLEAIAGDFPAQLAARLRTGPAPEKEMVRTHQPDPVVHARGLEVYNRTCIACHGPDGKGVPGAFPPLDGTTWVTGDPSVPIRVVLHGIQGPIEVNGQKFENIMPAHVDLNDTEIADVLTYIRQNWSNDATPIEPAAVGQTRAKYSTRKEPWTADELK
jgi:uncharacterized protein